MITNSVITDLKQTKYSVTNEHLSTHINPIITNTGYSSLKPCLTVVQNININPDASIDTSCAHSFLIIVIPLSQTEMTDDKMAFE